MKLVLQIDSQLLNNRFPPCFSFLPFYDHPSNIPIKADKLFVDRLESFVLRSSNALFYLSQKAWIYRCQVSHGVQDQLF